MSRITLAAHETVGTPKTNVLNAFGLKEELSVGASTGRMLIC